MNLRQLQLQTQHKEIPRVIHLRAQSGGAYCVPELYDLHPHPTETPGQTRLCLLRPDAPVDLWRGPTPVAIALIPEILSAIDRAESGTVIDVCALADSLTQETAQP